LCFSSDSIPSQRALAPVAITTARAAYSSSPTQTRSGCAEKSTFVHVVGDELGTKALRLPAEVGHHRRTHDAVGVARVVLDVAGYHQLAAPGEAFDHERRQVGARRVQGGRVAGRATADDDQLMDVLVAQGAPLEKSSRR